MSKSICFLILFLLVSVAQAAENVLTPEQINDGWIALFDGETLFGWEATSDANWRVEEGAITVDAGEEGWLMTTSEFAGYELHLEFKAPPTTNSGVFLCTPLAPKDPSKDCYEFNIAPQDNPFPTGSIVGRLKWDNAQLTDYPELKTGWSPVDLVVQQGRIINKTFARKSVTYSDPQPIYRGHIGLQFREGRIAFRNIRLKPLDLKPIFNGRDLTGWNTNRIETERVLGGCRG